MHTYIHTDRQTYRQTDIHIHIYMYMYVCIYTCMMHVCLYTCMCFIRPAIGTHHVVEQVHALLSTLGGAKKLLNDVAAEETILMETRSRGLGMTTRTFIPKP